MTNQQIEQRIISVMDSMGRKYNNPSDFFKFYQETVNSHSKPANYTAHTEKRIISIMAAIDNQVD